MNSNAQNVVQKWHALNDAFLDAGVPEVIKTQDEYDRAIALLDEFLDNRAPDALINLLGNIIYLYEEEHCPSPPQFSARQTLAYLMEENDLTQNDLAEMLGGQSNVSRILSGKRKLNLQQIMALAKRFAVDPSAFMDEEKNEQSS